MFRRIATGFAGGLLVAALAAGTTMAANPPGPGQPGQSCQLQPTGPAGLLSTTNGFAVRAVVVYAGIPGTESAEANAKAVSQYDVACFEVSQQK